MKTPRTIAGYIRLIRRIELVSPCLLKGWDKLNKDEQEKIELMAVEISNHINEIKGA